MTRTQWWTEDEIESLIRLGRASFMAENPHRSRASVDSQARRLTQEGHHIPDMPRQITRPMVTPIQADVDRAAERMVAQADRNLALVPTQTVVEEPDDAQYEELFRLLEDVDEAVAALSPTQDSTEFHAPDDGLPVGIAITSDWHLGASGVESKRLRADMRTIGQTDGLYVIGLGDYVEGVGIYNKAVGAMYEGRFNDGDLQEMAALLMMKPALGKWLALASGNHDEWLRRASGLSRVQRLAKQLGPAGQRPPHFGQGGGTVFAQVGDQRYVIAIVHNATGNSRLNTTNVQRRLFDSFPQWENCDIICCAHLHFNDLHIATRKGGRCVYLRSGTAKTRDSYAADHSFTPEYGIPLVILLPDEKRVVPFRGDDFRRGVEYLTWLREQYRAWRQATEDIAA